MIRSIEKYHPNGIDRFVNVGCGDGFTSVRISQRYPDADVTAIDPSPMVKRLEGLSGIRPYHGILQNAPVQPDATDVVAIIGNWMLHTDPEDTARCAYETLRLGGTLILDFKNIRSLSRVLARWAFRLGVDKIAMRGWLQRNYLNMRFGYTRDFVRQMLTQLGFEVVEMYSKPPRLLEFKNRSSYQKGLAGTVWRTLNGVDRWRDEQAWVHVVCRKNSTPK
ncbi:class I SAM-dependent methyltransferase [Rhodopirellula sallentina]|uniref:class I SAM-dependent methyltransferase n=1 Tax=Rhodopirellula sallentina TaxID=1263869 RepID=UPI001360B4A7|nr:class I SAM-dependent methyltransferase [Rhodopirellula sallentina]